MQEKKTLTKAEQQVMSVLWDLSEGGGFIADVLERYPDPKPAYTTLSTFLKILTNKGFVTSRLVGKMLWFTPTISREEYAQQQLTHIKDDFFGGSVTSLISFYAQQEQLSPKQIEELIDIISHSKSAE